MRPERARTGNSRLVGLSSDRPVGPLKGAADGCDVRRDMMSKLQRGGLRLTQLLSCCTAGAKDRRVQGATPLLK